MAALLGLSKKALLKKKDTEHWIKIRQNAGVGQLGRQSEIDMARAIFKAWDSKEKGYLSFMELTE